MSDEHEYAVGQRDGRYVVLRNGVPTAERFVSIEQARREIARLRVVDEFRRQAFSERMADLLARNLAFGMDSVPEIQDWTNAWAWFYEQPLSVQERINSNALQLKAAARN
ncbi:hypothetical protein [Pandoraea communis]|uniref:hypothetical protein n=1 Tax=Pandoraea communis TaxID=2508297 RepID=UPI0025A665B6|nr:hypothetical protein [Pandoraea communis]MDM8359020.1 hypothetical protein [Pandoraea communis]